MQTSGTFNLPKTVVFGSSGFLGRHFFNIYKAFDPLLEENDRKNGVDLCNPSLQGLVLKGYEYALIASGMGKPLLCEKNPSLSYECNVKGTLRLCRMLSDQGIVPILFSSDYVFDGMDAPYDESAKPSPLNHYGRQKAELEEKALSFFPHALIIRLSKVYCTEKGSRTLLDEILTSFSEKKFVQAARDQMFNPISLEDVSRSVISLQKAKQSGLYNVAGNDCISRETLAKTLAKKMGLDASYVHAISLDDLSEELRRPKSTLLKIDKMKVATGIAPSSLAQNMSKIVAQYGK